MPPKRASSGSAAIGAELDACRTPWGHGVQIRLEAVRECELRQSLQRAGIGVRVSGRKRSADTRLITISRVLQAEEPFLAIAIVFAHGFAIAWTRVVRCALQSVAGTRVRAASRRSWRSRSGTVQEQKQQKMHGVARVEPAAVIGVPGVVASQSFRDELIEKDKKRINDVHEPVAIRVPTAKAGWRWRAFDIKIGRDDNPVQAELPARFGTQVLANLEAKVATVRCVAKSAL